MARRNPRVIWTTVEPRELMSIISHNHYVQRLRTKQRGDPVGIEIVQEAVFSDIWGVANVYLGRYALKCIDNGKYGVGGPRSCADARPEEFDSNLHEFEEVCDRHERLWQLSTLCDHLELPGCE